MPKKPPPDTAKEDESDFVTVEYLGETYTIPKDRDDWPWIAHELFLKGNYSDGVRNLIGNDQWKKLYRDGALTRREYREFCVKLGATAKRECVGD